MILPSVCKKYIYNLQQPSNTTIKTETRPQYSGVGFDGLPYTALKTLEVLLLSRPYFLLICNGQINIWLSLLHNFELVT